MAQDRPLITYAAMLRVDPEDQNILKRFLESALSTPLKAGLLPQLETLKHLKLMSSAFVIFSVVGQELLSNGKYEDAICILEHALSVGSVSLKLRGSVFSALGSAHWALNSTSKAIACMQQDLATTRSLGDLSGECRALGNIAAAFFHQGHFRETLQYSRAQLALAIRLKDRIRASTALSLLGRAYVATGDYSNALTSHKHCVVMLKKSGNKIQEAHEIGSVGAVYLASGDVTKAMECYFEQLTLSRKAKSRSEEARALSNIGSAYHCGGKFEKAAEFHHKVLAIAGNISDKILEERAYAGLGHAARAKGDFKSAKNFHEKQLGNALACKNKAAESRACANLGVIYHLLGEYDGALRLHKSHLGISKTLQDRSAQGRAYGNIGNVYNCQREFELAIRFHKQQLNIAKEVDDLSSEMATHGNLAVSFQQLGFDSQALQHFTLHLNMTRKLRDVSSEAKALQNLGNFYCTKKQFQDAVPFFEALLKISKDLNTVEFTISACHKLGYANYCLGLYTEAIKFYTEELTVMQKSEDFGPMCKAVCNLGLAYKKSGNFSEALKHQKCFLALASRMKNNFAKYVAMGNIGDVYVDLNNFEDAVNFYKQQLTMAKNCKNRKLQAKSYSNLGFVHRKISQFDKALAFHTQELNIYQEVGDVKGECIANGSIGNVHTAIGNHSTANRCYEEQLDRSRDVRNTELEAGSYGNLAISKMNLGYYDDAIGYLEQQLAMLEGLSYDGVSSHRGKAYCNLGDCYDTLGDYEEAIKCFEQFLAISLTEKNMAEQDVAYRRLANAHRSEGNVQQALVCFEKRLVLAHELDNPEIKSSAYGELGCLHSLLGNYEQAILCLQHQLRLAREQNTQEAIAEAACGLGGVYQHMGEYQLATEHHNIDLEIGRKTGNRNIQCRAYGNLGLAAESKGDYDNALKLQEIHMELANEINDPVAITLALSSLGRITHAQENYTQAISYLERALQVSKMLHRLEDEAKISHRYGLALCGEGRLEEASLQLYRVLDIFDLISNQSGDDRKISLFDLQAATFQILQRVLVKLGKVDDALVVAERGKSRAFVDYLLERQNVNNKTITDLSTSYLTMDAIMKVVSAQRAPVVYYSLVAGYIYCWLLIPNRGCTDFFAKSLSELENLDASDSHSFHSSASVSALDTFVDLVHESLGLVVKQNSVFADSAKECMELSSETESDSDDVQQNKRLSKDNSSFRSFSKQKSRSTSSLRSSITSRSSSGSHGNTGLKRLNMASPVPRLYQVLFERISDVIDRHCANTNEREIVFVLQGELHLIPFALLNSTKNSPYLADRYSMLMVPSLQSLSHGLKSCTQSENNKNTTREILLVTSPEIPQAVANERGWNNVASSETTGKILGELLGTVGLTGPGATKQRVLQKLKMAELIHFTAPISWRLSSIVLSPPKWSSQDDISSQNTSLEPTPSLADYLLAASDFLGHNLTAKLVVMDTLRLEGRQERLNADGLVAFTRALLAAGAKSVLYSLWPVPRNAANAFFRNFYGSIQQGVSTTTALSEATGTLRKSHDFAHPSNWAAWVIMGENAVLSSTIERLSMALAGIIKSPDKTRESFRVLLHLTEKAIQRVAEAQSVPMYTNVQSIENKVKSCPGWRELLVFLGFRFEASSVEKFESVFFPTSNPEKRLYHASDFLQAVLGLPVTAVDAVSTLMLNEVYGKALHNLLLEADRTEPKTVIPADLWRTPGVHEFLAALGFELLEVGEADVKIKRGRCATEQLFNFGITVLAMLFDPEAKAEHFLSSRFSSMESLASSCSTTSQVSSRLNSSNNVSSSYEDFNYNGSKNSASFLQSHENQSPELPAKASSLLEEETPTKTVVETPKENQSISDKINFWNHENIFYKENKMAGEKRENPTVERTAPSVNQNTFSLPPIGRPKKMPRPPDAEPIKPAADWTVNSALQPSFASRPILAGSSFSSASSSTHASKPIAQVYPVTSPDYSSAKIDDYRPPLFSSNLSEIPEEQTSVMTSSTETLNDDFELKIKNSSEIICDTKQDHFLPSLAQDKTDKNASFQDSDLVEEQSNNDWYLDDNISTCSDISDTYKRSEFV